MKDKTKSGEEVKEIVEDLLMSVNTYKEICNQENMVAPPEKKPQQPEAEGLTVSECEEFLLRSFCEIVAGISPGCSFLPVVSVGKSFTSSFWL